MTDTHEEVRRFRIITPGATGAMAFRSDDPVKFMDFLRGMFGKRMIDSGYDPKKALYKSNAMTSITLVDGTWMDIERPIMAKLMPEYREGQLGTLGSAEVKAVHEASEGGLYNAIDARIEELGLQETWFQVTDPAHIAIHKHVCRSCAGSFMQWSQRGWGLTAYESACNECCDICGLQLNREV